MTETVELCELCEKNPGTEEHICQYKYELGGSTETCNCCQSCANQCAMDI